MARLVLVGLPGVGKSTLAAALANHWRCGSLDTDDLIAQNAGMSPAHLLREQGEKIFRQREFDALREALESDGVVATGAGVVTTSDARDLLEKSFAVWLDCDDETLLTRVSDGERPLLGDDHRLGLAKLRVEREAWYKSVARVRVDASGSIDEVMQRVFTQIEKVAP
ncbi:MAG TPA: shikimate kinase [Acidimicrobiales bacterium]